MVEYVYSLKINTLFAPNHLQMLHLNKIPRLVNQSISEDNVKYVCIICKGWPCQTLKKMVILKNYCKQIMQEPNICLA